MSNRPLEPPSSTLRSWFETALDLSLEHVEGLSSQPSFSTEGAIEEAASLVEKLPEQAVTAPRELLERLVREWVPRSFNTAGPGYLAYVPGGGLPTAALADLIAGLCNRYLGVFAAAPLLARLEVQALRWLMDEMDYPGEARGIFTSGGSLATLSAVVCARTAKLGDRFQNGVLYVTDQAHHCVIKSAQIAGLARAQVHELPGDSDGRWDLERLQRAVTEDRRAGQQPFLVIASAGTVNTGAVDDLVAVGDLARSEGLWLHVDGAYGGCFRMTQRGRERLRGIERADSIVLDPHKGLFLPYGTGCLMVRDGELLRRAHSVAADYLPAMQSCEHAQDSCEYSPELSRDFRGLRVWLSFKLFGAAAFRETLDEKLDLARHAHQQIERIEGLCCIGPPDLSLVAFGVDERRLGDGSGAARIEEANRLTRRLLEAFNARRRLFVSATRFRERFVIRWCILSFRTHRDRIDEGLAILREETAKVLSGR